MCCIDGEVKNRGVRTGSLLQLERRIDCPEVMA